MKANELMIGDWVECTYWTPSKQLKVAEIRRIMDDEIKIGVYSDDLVLIFRQSEVKPISLTPEILVKNDFELEQKLTYWSTYRILIDEETEHYLFLEFHSVSDYVKIIWQHASGHADSMIVVLNHCKVHQLQHALRLCGIPKEIEL